MWLFMLMLTILSKSYVNTEYIDSSSSSYSLGAQNDLHEMLNTEKVLIDTLRQYIDTQEQKLNFLKRKTLQIQNIHDDAAADREKYLYNPINAVTIIKRFTADWKGLKNYAEQYLNTDDFTKNYTQQLKDLTFPSDNDYDVALINLLRIQDMYKLEPQRLSVGEVNGVKLGAEMSWSDCLEIGLKSSKNGYQTYAKYWIETALDKLPQQEESNKNNSIKSKESSTSSKDNYVVKARLEIMKALLNTEYKMGNLKKALSLSNEMLEIQPKQKNVIKAKQQIENELKKQNNGNNNSHNSKNEQIMKNKTKSDEELMIEEICREASTTQINKQIHTASSDSLKPSLASSSIHTAPCNLVTNNIPAMVLQPLKVELLNLDPYVVIYHNVISDAQLEDLRELVVVVEHEDDMLELTKIGRKKMRQFNGRLHYIIGHQGQELYDDWQVERYDFENLMELPASSSTSSSSSSSTLSSSSSSNENASQAKILFHLQQPIMGGAVIFPQMDLSINLPLGSLLYWSTLNEFSVEDYRSKYHICPVIGGTQITASNTIKNL